MTKLDTKIKQDNKSINEIEKKSRLHKALMINCNQKKKKINIDKIRN